MLKLSNLSENCYKSEIDLFSVPPTQTSVETGIWDTIECNPFQPSSEVIVFDIPGNSAKYLDLSQTELYAEISIKPIGATPTQKSLLFTDVNSGRVNALPINNFLHSAFRDIVVRFNTKIVEQISGTYPYKAYLEDTLNYDKESKETFLQQQCYFKNTPGEFEVLV